MSKIHHAALAGYSNASSTYVSGRPGYPAQIDGWLQDRLGICNGKQVVDLGAGTGKFTTHLVQTGADVIAVEPVRAMIDQLRSDFPGVEARQGNAAEIPLDSASVGAVFCAQSFHWFAGVETLAEIRRVLKPRGFLGLIWNVRDENCDWVAALSRIMAPYEEGTPRFHHGQWRSVFPADGFAELQELTFEHGHQGDFETVVLDRIMSVSFIAALSLSQRQNVATEVRALVPRFTGLRDVADVVFPYKTYVTWTDKL